MSLSRILLSVSLLSISLYSVNINVTTKYGKTGGILGPLNTVNDKINGRTICQDANTPGCDFENDSGYDNNGTVDDPSDDFYKGDLRVRTNDNFELIAAWTWSNVDEDGEESVKLTGTLPLKDGVAYYEWANLPGFCDASSSSLSEDKQTIVCVREDFDKHKANTYSEDLPFQVRVKGGAPNGTQPGDIKFKIESLNADTKEDTTDGNSLTITGSPKWNIYAGHYPYFYNATNPDTGERGYYVTFKFRVGPDEVDGEEDNVNPALGNESMGKDATFEFTDVLDKMPPNAKLLYCSMKGRTHTLDYYKDDGFIGYDEPLTYYGDGSLYNSPAYKDRHILAQPDEQKITCSKSGDKISIKIENVDATLNSYPTKNYLGGTLPKTRALASIASMHFFIPFSDIKNGNDNTEGTSDDYKYAIQHHVINFNPKSPSGNENFNGDGESEKDNTSNFTLPYPGGWSHGWRGKEQPNSSTGYIYQLPGGAWVSGDGVVTAGEEISTYTGLTGRDYSDYQACEILDAYRTEIVPIKDNKRYTNLGQRYVSDLDTPITIGIYNDTDDYTDGLPDNGSGSHDFDNLPYTVEYAAGYIDDSFLPSKGGDTSVSHEADIKRECTDSRVKWYSDFATARSKSPLGVTKVRFKLKAGKTVPVDTRTGFWVNTHIRDKDLATNQQMSNKDLIVTYGSKKIGDGDWYYSKYTPNTFDTTHVNQGQGDRIAYTGPKARISKIEDKSAISFNDKITYTLKPSYTVGTTTPFSGTIQIVDILPKDFNYISGSTTSINSSIGEPTIGSCDDVKDLDSSCDDTINQVLIWNLGTRTANKKIEDINYSVDIGNFAKIGISFNKVKIESDTDLSTIDKRKAQVGVNLAIPSSIDIIKSTQENLDYPSPRERTTTYKDITFVMEMRNGKDGDITNLDVIDLLPFKGDGEKVINYLDLKVNRKVPTDYHGSIKFHNASFSQHPKSETACDYRGGLSYYYTNEEPTKINIAPSVGEENDISSSKSIWCEGDENGPNGCTIASKNFTFTDNSEVTAVRVRGARMEKQAVCQFKVNLSVKDNLKGDNYSNSAGASAIGITLPVISNSLAVPIVGSSLGDRVWYDKNANGIQDEDEEGISGVKVKLLDDNGVAIKNPISPSEDYIVTTNSKGEYRFSMINSGKYIIEFEKPDGYIVSEKSLGGNSALDSDIDEDSAKTDIISLDVDSDDLTIDAGFYTPTISGKIFDDGNSNGIVDGTAISSLDGSPLYVTLLDENNNTLATKVVSPDGTYIFNGKSVVADRNYTVVLSTLSNAISSTLPKDWNSADGESIGSKLDSKADSSIAVSVAQEDVKEVNFGLNKRPEAFDVSKAKQFNPGGQNRVDVVDLNISDKEDGIPSTVTIKTLPSNGKLYYNGTEVIAGQVITNFDNTQLRVDPDSGDVTVEFTYTTTDKVGVESDPATVTMPFKDLKISGHLFIDGNGDGNVNGTPTSTADGVQLYVTLIKGSTALASKALNGGAYEFNIEDGVKANSSFTIVLSDKNGTTIASLPTNWDNNDGENINSKGVGNDGSKDGILNIDVAEVDVIQADFGINEKPEAHDVTQPEQPNPGAKGSVDVPDLNISDGQSSSLDVNFTSVPSNAILYYDGAIVHAGDVIEDFKNNLLTIDPEDGTQNISFNYSVIDEAGVVSDIATVTMSFKKIVISGRVFNDGNGNGSVDGVVVSKIDDRELYVTLIDSTGKPISSKALDSNGSYYFDSFDGLSPDTNYTVVLTDTENSKESTLPAKWNSADGENIGLIGLDGKADGKIYVEVLKENINEINFGVNKQPEAEDKRDSLQINPGGTKQVAVPALEVSDREDKTPTTITIVELPTNGKLYYKGSPIKVGESIKNVQRDKFTLDPNDGDLTVEFKYTTTDRAGVTSKVATVTLPFKSLQILGNIFNDGNNDGVVNGIPISAPSGTQLYVTLLDSNGKVLASKEVSANGSYMFDNSNGVTTDSDYRVILTTKLNSTNASLPTDWSNLDGEHIGRNRGTDGSNDGRIDVFVANQTVTEVNFGINKRPVVGDKTAPKQLNPGGSVRVSVPNLLMLDNEDGNLTTVIIESLPKYGTLYYNGVKVKVKEEIHNFDNSLLMLDPDNGDLTISFTYSTVDSVGVKSDIATVTMPFYGLKIKGNIFDDGNSDGSVNGIKISKVDTKQLYVTLLNSSGKILSTKAIDSDGSYLFSGADGVSPDSSYTVILSSEYNVTNPTLPANWSNADGESIGLIGLDKKADGKVVVDVEKSDIIEVNFGINARPIAVDKVENLRLNPGGEVQVSVPKLEVADREDGTPKTVIVTKLPTNGVLYYNGVAVEKDVTIDNVDVSKFTIDPNNGDVKVIFEYVSVDSTGWHSEPATVEMPFGGLKISGKVFLDTNGDNRVDGMPFSSDSYGLQVYANLVDSNGSIVKTVAVDSKGEYIFDTTTGVAPNSDYRVVLSSEQNTTQATLPSNWEHTDHNTNGVIDIHVAISSIDNVNFGLNRQPVVHNVVAQERLNPTGDSRVDVPNLDIEPNEDGNTTATTVRLSNLPINATLYYNGVEVTEGQTINDFNNSLLVVDPDDYNVTVEFTYTVEDSAGFESEPATVTMPFADIDTDGDGVLNGQDLDDDNDGILDIVENNTSLNGGDTDGDGIPDRLDLDSDGDGILDLEESNPNFESVDSNGDGILDSTTDIDKDGVMDTADADDNNPISKGSVVPVDTDGDGQPDFQDIDSDNDGLSDVVEGGTDATKDNNSDGILDDLTDSDGDGIADVVDRDNGGTPATTPDTDKDGVDNYRDLDSDGDRLLDVIEINGTDSNNDGEIEPKGTLVDGTNLPDENSNGIPDVIEMKLKDDIKRVPAGSVATIDILENDTGDIAPDSVKLIIPKDFKGVARISADGKRVIVDGEGEWYVDGNGVVTFTPEADFRGNPTPIEYQATTKDGSKTSIATITLKVTEVAGVSEEECCEAYTDNSVPTFGIIGLILMVLFGSAFGAILLTKREE